MRSADLMFEVGMTAEDVRNLTTRQTLARSKYDNSIMVTKKHPDYTLHDGDVVISLRPPLIDVALMVLHPIPKEQLSMFPNVPHEPLYAVVRIEDGVRENYYRSELRLIWTSDAIEELWPDFIKTVAQSRQDTAQSCAILQARKAMAFEIKKLMILEGKKL